MATPTPVSKWIQPTDSEIVTLPSGNVAELRTNFAIHRLSRDGVLDEEALEVMRQEEADLPSLLSVEDELVAYAFINPRVVTDPEDLEDGALLVSQLTDADYGFVTAHIEGASANAVQFREGASEITDGPGDGTSSEDVGDDS